MAPTTRTVSSSRSRASASRWSTGPILHNLLGVCDLSPNDPIGDGVDNNDVPFQSSFPYVAGPHGDYEVEPAAVRALDSCCAFGLIRALRRDSLGLPTAATGLPWGFLEAHGVPWLDVQSPWHMGRNVLPFTVRLPRGARVLQEVQA
jgi:hypothetical protein